MGGLTCIYTVLWSLFWNLDCKKIILVNVSDITSQHESQVEEEEGQEAEAQEEEDEAEVQVEDKPSRNVIELLNFAFRIQYFSF